MTAVLASTGSIWRQDSRLLSLRAVDRNLKTDVCVVGAGIAGLSTAYLLSQAGRKVVVIDDGNIASGETVATTAHVSSIPDVRYFEIEQVDCDYRRLDAYLILKPGHDENVLDQELEAARRTGVIHVDRIERVPLPSFDSGPCIRYQGQAQFHPLRYLTALAEAIRRGGSEIYANSHATSIRGGKGACVEVHPGARIDANAVVVCTNSPVNDRVAIHTKQAPYLSYVIAARVPNDSVPFGLYWDTDDPFHYARLHRIHDQTSGDGSFHDYLIVGGEDHKTGQAHDGDQRFARLEAWTRERFPMIDSVEHRWTGQVLESIDGLPFIGRNPLDHENVFIATGFSGLGMTNGTLAGMIISDLIRGRDNPYAELYDPSRKARSLSSLRQFAKENLNVAGQYAALVTPGEVQSVDQISLGEGAVVRRGIHKMAVYRSDDGTLREMSAICPHLGCVVEWNSTDKTWDCPCHGSRFGAHGAVRNGPANTDLERRE
jgi:glycine/D-amino acid oxidase-like deaminating enzyme/nitrite reductase/ring-hydroxylating ferredoxin subunit